MQCKSLKPLEAIEWLSSYCNGDFRKISNTNLKLYGEVEAENSILPITDLAPFRSGNIVHPYLINRGFTQDDFVNFKFGWDSEKKRITIPFFNQEGELLGFSGRAVLNESDSGYSAVYGIEPKYFIYNNFKAKHYFYPLDKFSVKDDSIILVEGLLDAVWMHKCGYSNCLSIITASASKVQIEKLRCFNAKTIILCLDSDKYGNLGCERLYNNLKDVFNFKKCVIPKGKKDVQECTKAEIDYMMQSLESYPKRNFKMYED